MTTKHAILTALRSHKSQLAALGVRRIGLFGSYARDEQQPRSDIDILVEFDPAQKTFDNFMNLYDFLEELFAGEKIEVVTTNGLSPYIGPHVLKEVTYV